MKQRRRGKVVIFPYPERAELRGNVLLPEEDEDTYEFIRHTYIRT